MSNASNSTLSWIHGAAASLLLALPLAGLQAQQGEPYPQQAPTQQPAQPPQQQSVEVNDEMLKKFADAATGVQEVQQEYVGRIQSTQDQSEANSLREQAQEKMVSAVEEAGLSPAEYNMISMQVQSDPELMERFNDVQQD